MAAAAAPALILEEEPHLVSSVKKGQERLSAVNELLDKDQFDKAMTQNRLYLPPNFLDHLCEDAENFQKGTFRPGLDKWLLKELTFDVKDKLVFYTLRQEKESKKWISWPLERTWLAEFYPQYIDLDRHRLPDDKVSDGGVDAGKEDVDDRFVSWKQSEDDYARQLKRAETITPERVREMINIFIYKNMIEVPIIFVEMMTKIMDSNRRHLKVAVRVGKDENECCWYVGEGVAAFWWYRKPYEEEVSFKIPVDNFPRKKDGQLATNIHSFEDLKKMKDLKFYVWKEDVPWNGTTQATEAFDKFDFQIFFREVTDNLKLFQLTTTKSEKADIYRFVSEFYNFRYQDGRLSKLRDALNLFERKTLETYEKCYFDRYHSVLEQVLGKVPPELQGMIYALQPPSTTRLDSTTSYVVENPFAGKTDESGTGHDLKRRRLTLGTTVQYT